MSLPVSEELQSIPGTAEHPWNCRGAGFKAGGVPEDFGAASEQSCPVGYVESVQDGHLLALRQSSAFSKASLAPVLDVYF